jgi:hypothetical protein
MRNHRRRGACLLITTALAVLGTSVGPGALLSRAAASAMPPTANSHYINHTHTTGSTSSTAYTWGCNQARADNSHNADSFVTLDFGAQTAGGGGTYLPGQTTYSFTNGTIENFGYWFAAGYQFCYPAHRMWVNIATNNSRRTNGELGHVWGLVVQDIANFASSHGYANVSIAAGNDIESWGPYADISAWEWGTGGGSYAATTRLLVSNYGSADGCPTSYHQYTEHTCAVSSPNYNWPMSKYYWASWGWGPNLGNPEIYVSAQSVQWANISDWGRHYNDANPIYFQGPLSTPRSGYFTPSQSWAGLTNALNTEGVPSSMSYSTNIVW